jgi:predicted homoserine dehydrogenase-like protein
LLSVRNGYVPLGLANQVKLIRSVVKDQAVSWDDIEIDPTTSAYRLRKEVEAGVAQ